MTTSPTGTSRRLLPALGSGLLAFVQTVGTFRASRVQVEDRPLDVLAVLLLLIGPAALLMVRRRPVLVLGVVTAATLAYLVRDYAYGPVVLSQVVVTIVAVVRGHRAAAWTATGALLVPHFALRAQWRDEPWSWGIVGGVSAWALVILGIGELIRVRRERALTFRRAAEERRRRQANEERLRIARELHDTVAHHMSLINIQASVALHLLDRRPEQAEVALGAIRDASKEGLAELRSVVAVLRDERQAAPRAPTATLRSLDEVLGRTQTAGILVDKVVTGVERPLPTAVELAAFRIVQEAITNVHRHASAGRTRVTLGYGDAALEVRVDDDGRGVDAHAVTPGSGLLGMRERAAALGGSLLVERSPDLGGTRVRAQLPLAGGGR